MERRNFLKIAGLTTLGIMAPRYDFPFQEEKGYLYHDRITWEEIGKGLEFSRTDVYLEDRKVDTLATLKINPFYNKIRVFNNNGENNEKERKAPQKENLLNWQKKTGAIALINGNQYMSKPTSYPCALVICDGIQKGPKYNSLSRGMFVAEPEDLEGKLRKADILDFDYDEFDYQTTPYTQGVQHWPIILDRKGKIKVKKSLHKAKRSVIAKTNEEEILFMATEGNYFSLHNLGELLRKSNSRLDYGFNINTAMNLDGGFSAGMIISTQNMNYIHRGKIELPGVIGVFPRE